MALKALFLIFHGFEESNGISKKIRYQIKALKQCGVDVRTCWLDDKDGHKYRMIDDQILEDYGSGFMGKIRKRTNLDCIYKYITINNIDFIYVRSDHHTTPFLVRLYKKIKNKGVKILLEIPTYPYDVEYKGLPWGYQWILLLDKCLRKRMAKYIDRIITFSDDDTIFNCPTIKLSNGVDFPSIPLKQEQKRSSKQIEGIALATIHPWHGFDRIIEGLALYHQTNQNIDFILHIVGAGVPQTLNNYHHLVKKYGLENYVLFHGPLYGKELDDLFERCDIGIGSLARHRSGIKYLKSLKNREYAARGIPFIYSEIDSDFESKPYILKFPADESPIPIDKVITFYKEQTLTSLEIRQSIEDTLSWKKQMQIVISALYEKDNKTSLLHR